MKKLIPVFLLLFCCRPAHAQATYPAANCTTSAIQAAITAENASPANGDVITVPSCGGAVTFTTVPNSFNTSVSLTIQGQTTVSTNCATPPTSNAPCTAADNTSLIDGRGNQNNPAPFFSVGLTGGSSQVVRITGFTFTTTSGNFVLNHGEIAGGGVLGSATGQIRVDHNHFITTPGEIAAAVFVSGTGVIDHNVFDATADNNGASINSGGDGSVPWNSPTGFGTSGFMFMENNTYNGGFANDCKKGGKYVYRYNVMYATGNSSVQSHATGSDPSGSGSPQGRGCRAWEVYGNYFSSTQSGGSFSASFQTSGTGLQWGNTESNYDHALIVVSDRDNNSTYGQMAPPAGWGYCGSAFTGTASGWDGNTPSSATGYPCLDQIGRGQGDLLTGSFDAVCVSILGCSTSMGQWPNQALEPVYLWMENFAPVPDSGGGVSGTNSPNGNVVNNRDIYAPNASFNGTSGTGYGPLASRPSTCAQGPSVLIPAGGKLPGVAYWATDTNTLYVCYPANTWNAYYTPYTYPHPLVTGNQTSGTPLAPTNLTATVN